MQNSESVSAENASIAMIAEYVVECRGKGHFLPPTEIEIIKIWVRQSPNVDVLVVTLSELLPAYFNDDKERRFPKSLKGLDRKVQKKLSHFAARPCNPI